MKSAFLLLLGLLLAVTTVVSAAEGENAEEEAADNPTSADDTQPANLTTIYCLYQDQYCTGDQVAEPRFAVTLRQCETRCSYLTNCLGANYDTEQICYLIGSRCEGGASLRTDPGANFLYRIRKGEQCPEGTFEYEEKKLYSMDHFCAIEGKSCDGKNLYPKSLKIPDVQECLEKCTRIVTCAGVDHDGELCWPKSKLCSDAELVDTVGMNHFQRNLINVADCPKNRKPVNRKWTSDEDSGKDKNAGGGATGISSSTSLFYAIFLASICIFLR